MMSNSDAPRTVSAEAQTALHSPRPIRIDIQLLRALAILLVVAHHARLTVVPGGFLGVDIFFVISGYLMTTLIDEGLRKRTFTFSGFFARRVRRILPASYATVIVTALLAPALLDGAEFRNFVGQLAGSFGFVVNMVLWKQSEYFGSAATFKPLLHMWSLAVEEQFYLGLPVVLALCTAKFRTFLVAFISIVSFALCVWFVRHGPSAAFYLLPTRAWELGIGSIVALLVVGRIVPEKPRPGVRILAACVVTVVPLFADEWGHPGLPALSVCLATAVLLLPGQAPGRMSKLLSPLLPIGDRSFSLYLVHWPVFAFANNIFMTEVPRTTNILLLVICVLWMEAQFRLIEQPLRQISLNAQTVAALVCVPILVVAGSVGVMRTTGSPAEVEARMGNIGLSEQCDYRVKYSANPECQTSPSASTLVWGDSYAIALIPALVGTDSSGVVQATRTVCGPFVGLAPTNDALYPLPWAQSCVVFNRDVMNHIAAHPEIRTVVLSSSLAQYVPGAEDRGWSMLVSDSNKTRVRTQAIAHLHLALNNTAAQIRQLGRRVILIAPPPSDAFDSARCLDRVHSGKPTITPDPECRFTRESYVSFRKPILAFLEDVRKQGVVPVLSFDDVLCSSGRCLTEIDGVMLYRDAGHLSMPGAARLGKRMHLGQLVSDSAR